MSNDNNLGDALGCMAMIGGTAVALVAVGYVGYLVCNMFQILWEACVR